MMKVSNYFKDFVWKKCFLGMSVVVLLVGCSLYIIEINEVILKLNYYLVSEKV